MDIVVIIDRNNKVSWGILRGEKFEKTQNILECTLFDVPNEVSDYIDKFREQYNDCTVYAVTVNPRLFGLNV